MKKRGFIGTKISKYIASGVLLFSMLTFAGCDKKEDKSSEIQELKDQIALIQSQNEELVRQIAELQAQNQALIDSKNEEIAEKNAQIDALTTQIETLTSSVTSLNQQITNLTSQIEALETANAGLEGKVEDIQAQKDALQAQLNVLNESLETANEQIEQLQADKTTLEGQVSTLEGQVATLEEQKAALEEELEDLTKFTITFDTQGGSAVPSQKKIPGVTVDKPTNPTKKGYTFVRWVYGSESTEWNFEHDVVNGNITLVAVWNVNSYTLTYSLEGGTFSPAHASSDVIVYDTNFTLPTVVKDSYAFVRWENNGVPFKAGKWTYDKNITITCVWAQSASTITYKFNYDGKADETQNVSYNENFELLAPERAGYTFTGWTYNDAPISSGKYTYLGDITVNATWSPNNYVLTLDGGEGSYTGESEIPVTFDSEFDLPVCEGLSEDRPFAGWFDGRTRITDSTGHSLLPWTRAEGVNLVAKYFHPISTKQDFLDIALDPSTIYSLVNDVDFGGEEITPLDTFEGELWGMDYSITNVLFNSDSATIGLFKKIEDAKFSNLGFKDCVINVTGEQENTTYHAGLLAATALGDNVFENVSYEDVTFYVDAPGSKVIMGGLIGKAENLTLKNVTSGGVIEAKSAGNNVYLGGFVGETSLNIDANNYINEAEVKGYSLGGEHETSHAINEGLVGGLVGLSNTSYLLDSFNEGIVKEDSLKKTDSYAGGLIGKNLGRPEFNNVANRGNVVASAYGGGVLGCSAFKGSFSISQIYNEGEVSDYGDTGYLGGIIGRCLEDTLVSQTYNSGEINSSSGVAGGLIGYGDSIITLQESYNDGTVYSENGSAGGLVGSSKTAKLWDCYNIGTISAKTYAGGLIAVNAFPNTTISNSYVGGTVRITADSLDGKVGAFVGKSPSTSIGSSFVFATLIGHEGDTNSFVGQYEGAGGSADNVVSAATAKDLDDNVITEPSTDVELISLETITNAYIESVLLFNSSKWNINFDTSLNLYPTLKCFED